MMAKHYLVTSEYKEFDSGSIVKHYCDRLTDCESGKSYQTKEYFINKDFIELSESKKTFFLKKDKKYRLSAHNSQLFERIAQLKENDEITVNDKGQKVNCTFKRTSYIDPKYVCVQMNGEEKKILISDIISISNKKYYIFNKTYSTVKEGTIIVEEDGNKKIYKEERKISYISVDKLVRISEEEANILYNFKLEERIKIMEDTLLDYINKLKVGDLCCLRGDVNGQIYKITGKNIEKDCVKYTIKSTMKDNTNEITQYDIDPLMVKYYLVTSTNKLFESGSIVKYYCGQLTDIEDKTFLGYGTKQSYLAKDYQYFHKLIELSESKMKDLSKMKINNRVKIHNSGLFEEIKQLKSNDKIILKEKGQYSNCIFIRISESDSEYVYVKMNGVEKMIFISNIESIMSNPTEKTANQYEIISSDNTTAKTVEPYKSILYKPRETDFDVHAEDSLLIKNKETKLKIINPKKINKIVKEKNNIDNMKILVIKDSKDTAILKWKGLINNSIICAGCEMDKDLDCGWNGKFKDEKIFDCKEKRGVLIQLNSDGEDVICERVKEPKHRNITKNKYNIIEEDSICCIQEKIFQDYDFRKKDIILSKDIRGRCKWSGLVNGEECVGVEMEPNTASGYTYDGLIKKLNMFGFTSLRGALFTVKDIPFIIRCNDNNLDVVIPDNIQSIDNGEKYNKLLFLKQNNISSTINLKWKGKVNGKMCLGCELNKDSKYGTSERFKDNQLFDCQNKRCVFIILDESLECCERDETKENNHNKIEIDDDKYIEDKCICCFENKDQIESASHINIGNEIIIKDNLHGKIKWKGRVNNEDCVGIDLNRVSSRGTNRTFKGIELFDNETRKAVLMRVEDICKSINCEKINMKIINFTNIKIITPRKDNKSLFVILRRNNEVLSLEVKWKGDVDGRECLGCILPFDYQYGTDGTFKTHPLFQCNKGRGVLIDIEEFSEECIGDNNTHGDCKTSHYNNIIEDSICCIENINKESKMKVGDAVAVKKGQYKVFGRCLWKGLINGREAVGVSLNIEGHFETNRTFCGVKLFDCKQENGFLYLVNNVEKISEINFIKNIYLKNDFNLKEVERSQSEDMQAKLVCVEDNVDICGRVMFGISLFGESLTMIKINEEYKDKIKETLKDIIFHEECMIVVKSSLVKIFKEELKYIRGTGTKIIDIKSIKIKERYASKELKKEDIVKYKDEDGEYFGRIVRLELLNGVPCVGVVDTIKISENVEEKYIKEENVEKIIVDASLTKYLEDTIIDPHSIVTFIKSEFEGFNIGDKVMFRLKYSLKEFEGDINMIVEANGILSVVVKLTELPLKFDISKYIIKDIQSFKDLFNCRKDNLVIVVFNTVHLTIKNKILFCVNNNVTILDPLNVKTSISSPCEDRLISFKSKGNTVVATLKWTGVVNKERFMGFEMRNISKYGTNGTFGDKRLFYCEKGKGVLIKVDNIEECCVNGHDKEVKKLNNGRINGESVCCIKKLEILKNKSNLKLGERIMSKKGNIFGTCRWMGLVNNKEEIIGVEMVQCCETAVNDEWIDKLALFDCPPNKGGLFLPQEFTQDSIGLCHCSKNNVDLIDCNNIKSVENGNTLKKKMMYKYNNKTVIMDIKWRGIVNGALCVACELNNECNCGTDGQFGEHRLFNCPRGKGVLIPVDTLEGSCEDKHNKIVKYNDSISIKEDCICCVETLEEIKKWPTLTIGGRIKYSRGWLKSCLKGVCKWMGNINGKESIGVKMDKNIKYGTKGNFSFVNLFECKEGRGVILLSEDVEHDIEGEKLNLIGDKIVDLSKIAKIKTIENSDIKGIKIGDYVSTSVKADDRGEIKELKGELKWIGKINGEKCVGIDLEEEYPKYGMDGTVNEEHIFKCPPLHGVVTKIDGVHKIAPNIEYINEGMINVNKYLKCEENWNGEYLKEKNVFKDGPLFVIINIYDNEGRRWKRKGTLRWSGVMNELFVAVVELDQDCEHGTDGVFWRQRLITCRDKRAVAVSWDNIHRYIPYETMSIPTNIRKFNEIDINSSVIYYVNTNNYLTSLYGTVKWSGINEYNEYLYGIELDDKYKDGTDGQFNGQRLFNCPYGHGVLAFIEHIAPDTRFIEQKFSDEDIAKSEVSDTVQYGIPIKTSRGEHKGIQGNANSCYFDSSIFALFSKSDVLDFMITPKINEIEKDEITKRFREIMSWKIVYSLRKFGYVSFHFTKEMREVIKDYGGKFLEMTKQETDMENVAALLVKLCPNEQLLSLKSFSGHMNKGMFLQLFITLDSPKKNISSQQMLDMSMAQNEILFDKPPTCLIIQAPRDARGINCYENVLPSKTIEMSNLCFSYYKKCTKCDEEATYICKECMSTSLRTKDGLLCDIHKQCLHEEIKKLPLSDLKCKSEVQMQLKAIICIEKAHFVAYVKEDEFKEEWVFFDSMSTQNISNNYAVPKVSFEKNVSHFLNLSEVEMEEMINQYKDVSLKRILKDSYIFVYHNTAKTCY